MLTVLPKQEAEAAAVRRCSTKQVFLKKSVKSTEKNLCWSLFFDKIVSNFITEETPAYDFQVNFVKFSETIFFWRTSPDNFFCL